MRAPPRSHPSRPVLGRSIHVVMLAAAASLAACDKTSSSQPDGAAPADSAAAAVQPQAPVPDAAADASPSEPVADASIDASIDAAEDALAGASDGCPDNMVVVQGRYCPNVDQRCVEHHEEYNHDQQRKKRKKDEGDDPGKSTVSERCLRYEQPSECLSKDRIEMRYCMDRYEWPNKKGELPRLLISWLEAKKTCESIGKRLCTEREFNFACEGEQMLPYTYGYERDPTACNIDKAYRKREKRLYTYDRCMQRPECKAELEKLDQRLAAGSMPRCVSPFGVYDLNGNINEWVSLPGKKYPNRSGLKGGWWGPVRGRCRPTVGFHKEDDYGYEEGFRCCKDASP